MWPPASQWYSVAMYLATWTLPDDWGGVKPRPESLETSEPNVPTNHREAVGWMAWMFLAVLWQASLEVQDQVQWVQQLQRQEEALERWLVAANCLLQSPDGLLPSIPQQTWPVIRQQVEAEEPLAPEGQADGAPQAKKQTTLIQYTPAELQDLTK